MSRSSPKPSRRAALDLDEIAPNRFLVHNPRAFGLLKGEGKLQGRLFELTTWRREGLLARLRERGIEVRTIADRIAALPGPAHAPAIGQPGWRPLASALERYGYFDPAARGWRPLDPATRDGGLGVLLAEGWVLRRRKGRGPWSHYLAFRERTGSIGLRPLDETEALRTGYAQAVAFDPRPWPVARRSSEHPAAEGAPASSLVLPDAELPIPHRDVLVLFARPSPEGPLVDWEHGWPLAQELYAKLGVRLAIEG
jgi:hypothetical protein